jgi:D-amino-acid oxidase
MAKVTVVGAGVIGLSTAVVLERAGHDVTLVAREKGQRTTSGAAGAVWLPFHVGPPSRVVGWARRTREELVSIARRFPDAGVDMVDAFIVAESEEVPWWSPAVDDLERVLDAPRLEKIPCWRMSVPRCDPRSYLPWLEAELRGPVVVGAVDDLESMGGDYVVNCSGLGARDLARDTELEASFGQTVIVEGPALDPTLMVSDDRDPGAMFYVIPRRGEFVLGGCSVPIASDVAPEPDPELSRAIVERCRRMGYDPGSVLRARTGLRPVRAEVRLERDARIVHNYGHGGAGYTLSWGCAEEVTRLLA